MNVLCLVEAGATGISELSQQAIALARTVGAVEAAAFVELPDDELGVLGVRKVHRIEHPLLDDYSPEGWGESIRQLLEQESYDAVLAAGTERGNEVLAQLGARTDLPMVANVLAVTAGDGAWTVTRVRWGGSLLEEATLTAPTKLLTVAPHSVPATPAEDAAIPEVARFSPVLDEAAARTKVRGRVTLAEGITLATAPVVVSGGRGMGSADNFELLEELAGLVGGAVGCSRVATNNGWRSHADQVGQTGTKVAPDLYIACGISGAIQHWVGMMASKRVLAINTDAEAPMVTKSDYAVIGDVLEVVPAVIEEIKRRSR